MDDKIDMDMVAKWMGWDQINLRMLQEKMSSLIEENKKLKQDLADACMEKGNEKT